MDWLLEMPDLENGWQAFDWTHFLIEENEGKMESFSTVSWERMPPDSDEYNGFKRVGKARCLSQKKDNNRILMEVFFFDQRKSCFRFWFNQREVKEDTTKIGFALLVQDQWVVKRENELLDGSFRKNIEGKARIIFMFKNRKDVEDIRSVMMIQE